MLRNLGVLALAASLGGCVSLSRSAPVAPIPADLAADGRVEEIVVDTGNLGVSPEFEAIFRQRVKATLDGCATGARPLRLEAKIDRLSKTNSVVTAVLAGANVLRGTARLQDVETGAFAGEYQIGQTVVGGRVAVIVMAQAEEQMSDAFGDELCKQAFARTPAANAAAAPSATGAQPQ